LRANPDIDPVEDTHHGLAHLTPTFLTTVESIALFRENKARLAYKIE
jgi:hypothetical protein